MDKPKKGGKKTDNKKVINKDVKKVVKKSTKKDGGGIKSMSKVFYRYAYDKRKWTDFYDKKKGVLTYIYKNNKNLNIIYNEEFDCFLGESNESITSLNRDLYFIENPHNTKFIYYSKRMAKNLFNLDINHTLNHIYALDYMS